MFRFLMYVAIGYLLWTIAKAIARTFGRDTRFGNSGGGYGSVQDQQSGKRDRKTERPEIQDAKFEDITGDKKDAS